MTMNVLRQTLLASAALSLTACGSNLTCDDPQAYQQAMEGQRVEAPDGLDDLQVNREIQIPRASPREPRPQGSPCLELPPTLSVGGGDETDGGGDETDGGDDETD